MGIRDGLPLRGRDRARPPGGRAPTGPGSARVACAGRLAAPVGAERVRPFDTFQMSAADLPHIREGTVADAPASIREVAARAGVSVGTVSNTLNRPDIVAEPTRSRVRATIKQLGFIRNESARQLRAGRSRTIGLVVPDVANPFFTDVARGV